MIRFLTIVGLNFLFWGFTQNLFAQSLIIYTIDAKEDVIPLKDMKKITFDSIGFNYHLENRNNMTVEYSRMSKIVYRDVTTDIESIATEMNDKYEKLTRVYPHPVRDNLNVSFYLPEPTLFFINIISSLGITLQRIELGHYEAGDHTETLDLSKFSSGCYILELNTANTTLRQPILKH